MKTFGFEKTHLHLTDKAADAYQNCDPLKILENDDGTYSVRGIMDRDGMTEDDVNAFLEELADDAAETAIEDDTLYNVPAEWFNGGTPEPITGAEVKALAREWGSSLWEILQQIEEA